MLQPHRARFASATRRGAVLLVATAYLLAAIGFPLPAHPASSPHAPVSACGCDLESRQARSCCCAPQTGGRASCCSQTKTSAASAERIGVRWGAGVQEQKCQGVSSLWLLAGGVLSPSAVTPSADETSAPAADWIDALTSWRQPPVAPPPRPGTPGCAPCERPPPVSTGETSAFER